MRAGASSGLRPKFLLGGIIAHVGPTIPRCVPPIYPFPLPPAPTQSASFIYSFICPTSARLPVGTSSPLGLFGPFPVPCLFYFCFWVFFVSLSLCLREQNIGLEDAIDAE